MNVPKSISDVILKLLVEGAPYLLPPLEQSVHLLYSLLPKATDSWDNLSAGQVWNWLSGWLILWWTGSLTDRPTDRPTDWLTDSVIESDWCTMSFFYLYLSYSYPYDCNQFLNLYWASIQMEHLKVSLTAFRRVTNHDGVCFSQFSWT